MVVTLIVAVIIVVLIVIFWIVRNQRKGSQGTDEAVNDGLNRQLYVGNLSYQVTEQDLKELFGKYGTIEQVRIVKNYHSGRSKGFGFVTYRVASEANNALSAHGQKYQGRMIVVRIAKPR
jgi:cold-inducible RNA-binding protein